MAWGQIAGAVIGGVMANQAAKKAASAQRYAADKSALGYTDARPYITNMYSRGRGYLDSSLDQGTFTGDTYAELNPTQMQGIDYLRGFASGLMPDAQNFMNNAGGFATNAANIYDQANQPSLDNAIAYATSSPQAQSLIEAAMRDSTRQLNEQTLPSINMGASSTGNTNSSRAGVAQALAQRAYDRRADVASGVFDDLTSQYLSSNSQDLRNRMSANDALKNIYGIGMGMGSSIGSMLGKAGGMLQANEQAQLDANRDAFERQRDFGLDQTMRFNAGILNNAPQSATRQPNLYNPQMAALSGAMQGFGFGGELSNLFRSQTPAPTGNGYTPIDYSVAGPKYGNAGGRKYGINNNIYGF